MDDLESLALNFYDKEYIDGIPVLVNPKRLNNITGIVKTFTNYIETEGKFGEIGEDLLRLEGIFRSLQSEGLINKIVTVVGFEWQLWFDKFEGIEKITGIDINANQVKLYIEKVIKERGMSSTEEDIKSGRLTLILDNILNLPDEVYERFFIGSTIFLSNLPDYFISEEDFFKFFDKLKEFLTEGQHIIFSTKTIGKNNTTERRIRLWADRNKDLILRDNKDFPDSKIKVEESSYSGLIDDFFVLTKVI